MWNTKKKFATFTSAFILTLFSFSLTISASADESTAATAIDDKPYDYYSDEYYDTNGNASLIKNENIIYDSEKMQFIAVTTKDGEVFYILIDYSSENGRDNVYFLNKVDSFDLYSLLYAENESDEKSEIDPVETAQMYADTATGGHIKDSVSSDKPDNSDSEVDDSSVDNQPTNNGIVNNTYLLIGGIAVLGVIIVVIFLLKSGKFGIGRKKKIDDIGDFEEDDYPEYGDVEDDSE